MDSKMHNDEKKFEELLRRTLRTPLPLPEGFAERIAAATRQGGRVRQHWRPWQRAAAAALAIAVLGGAGEGYHAARVHHADRIAAQVTLAVEIAQTALADTKNDAQTQVQEALKAAQPADTRKEKQ